jgi:mannose-6-phosphate isomerase-like protein (cupin superfamily)
MASKHRWTDVVEYHGDRPHPIRLMDDGGLTSLVAGLEPGLVIPPHPDRASVFCFLEGEGVMTLDDGEVEVGAGDIVVVDDGGVRGLAATTRLAFLATKATSPG